MTKAMVTRKRDYDGVPYLLLESKGVQGSAIIERSTVEFLVKALKKFASSSIDSKYSFIQLSGR